MLINTLTPYNYSNSYIANKLQVNAPRLKPQLSCDTVSFTGIPIKNDCSFFLNALSRGYDIAEPNFITKAKDFHRALKRVSEKLKEFGFEYDQAYNSACPIKKKKSVLDKYERQGSAQDIVRGTVYWRDQQDVSAFKKFLDAMKDEGWELAPYRKIDTVAGDFYRNKSGNIIKFPDLEIRQNGITKESLAPLGEFIQRADISKPRASTYSDWQARFISSKEKGTKESRQTCEVIFLYGPHYKDAKELEHKYVYEPVRKLKKIHVDMDLEHHAKGTPGYTIVYNFKEIQKRLVQFISQPLFTNAFHADLKLDVEKLPIEISKSYANLINSYAIGIQKALPGYYSQISKELLTDEQIVSAIKSSPSYKIRRDKEILPKEIKDYKKDVKDRITAWKNEDLKNMVEVIADLKQTISKFTV